MIEMPHSALVYVCCVGAGVRVGVGVSVGLCVGVLGNDLPTETPIKKEATTARIAVRKRVFFGILFVQYSGEKRSVKL